ncbi:MAG: type II 3-dehydroquinate dehydratase [Saprospiraceae bacterium]|nr:type II 3-dehydroquinate dehydratase [Saprospiraceae bacterium]
MKHILIVNGPNLNLLGRREVEIYGTRTFDDYFTSLSAKFADRVQLEYFQSNHEGALIDKIHEVGFQCDGIILNGGALTHTSLALADAIAAVPAPTIEVHISNIHAREEIRHRSLTAARCMGAIAGLGLPGYELALMRMLDF